MPALLTLAVLYAGIGGDGATRIDRQVHSLLDLEAKVEVIDVGAKKLHKLATHGSGAGDLARSLHADGVIAGELSGSTLQITVYSHDGTMIDLVELPLDNRALARSDLDALRETIIPDVGRLARAVKPEPEVEAATAPEPDADDADAAELEEDTDFSGGDDADEESPALHLRVAVGVGIIGRTYDPGPSSIAAYIATPVPAARVVAEVEPDRRVALDVLAERTVALTTTVGGVAAPTSITRWQATGTYRRPLGPLALGALLGLGRREFAIDSEDPARTPDGTYSYLVVGGRVDAHLGSRVLLRGLVAFEPVVAGLEPTEMSFGEARRWALELGAAVEVTATRHVFVAGAFDYQRFAWSFARSGSGGALDQYPTATMSVGARY